MASSLLVCISTFEGEQLLTGRSSHRRSTGAPWCRARGGPAAGRGAGGRSRCSGGPGVPGTAAPGGSGGPGCPGGPGGPGTAAPGGPRGAGAPPAPGGAGGGGGRVLAYPGLVSPGGRRTVVLGRGEVVLGNLTTPRLLLLHLGSRRHLHLLLHLHPLHLHDIFVHPPGALG